tara:strand:+ start:117 stop:668 length:552 start_codon:yes stop_codon:yes gene_type:complete
MYSILEKLENIERLVSPSYRGKRKSRSNNMNIVLVSHDNNLDWLIANKTQRDAIRLFETGRVLPTREDARDSLKEGKPSVSEYQIQFYTFYQLIFGHKIFRYMESDLSKNQGQNLKREFMDIYIEVDDDVQIDNIDKLTLKCEHTDPRGPDLIFKLDGREIARRGAPGVSSYDEVMKGNVGGM